MGDVGVFRLLIEHLPVYRFRRLEMSRLVRLERLPERIRNARIGGLVIQIASPDFSPGFRMMVRPGWFWVRSWTARHSRSYGWREGTCPGPPGACQRRKSVA